MTDVRDQRLGVGEEVKMKRNRKEEIGDRKEGGRRTREDGRLKVEVGDQGSVNTDKLNNTTETFEKCSILIKVEEGEDFNRPSKICRTYGTGRHTGSISRIKI